MKHYILPVLIACLALVVAACHEPEPEKQTLSVSPTTVSFTEEGGSAILTVTSNNTWYVEVKDSWIKASNLAGSGNGTIELTAGANTGDARSTTVTVKGGDITVTVNASQEAHVVKTLSLKEVRALYKGTDYKIADDLFTEGVVISDYRRDTDGGLNNYSSAKTMVISDGEAGLMLYCGAENKNFARGDKVRITLKGQTLSVYNNGPIQVNGLPLANIEKVGTQAPVAKEVTLDELLTGNYESMYVAVKDVQLKEELVGTTFVRKNDAGEEQNTSLAFEGKDGRDFDLFTSKYAVFRGETVPTGSGVLKGIAGKYGARIQLSISERGDFAGLTGARFSTGAHFSLSFTEYPAWGDAGSFDVTLTSDVEWTSSSSDAGFTVSPAQGTGTEKVKVSFNDNPSSTSVRTAVITFKTTSSAVSTKELKLTVTQQPFEVLTPSAVQGWMEMPAVPTVENRAFFSHDMTYGGAKVRNYSFWMDLKNRVALWVAYPLYQGMTSGVDRTDKWAYDPLVPRRYQANVSSSYADYDRGHQLPSADRLCNTEANEQTFYYTNVTPQNRDLNQGLWETVERKVRNQMSSSDTLYVVTGCGFKNGAATTFAKDAQGHEVGVPDYYYKVVLKYKAGTANGGYSAIGFLVDNKAYGNQTVSKTFAKTVDEIETLTGIDFFVNLKDEYQKEAEAKYDASAWGL